MRKDISYQDLQKLHENDDFIPYAILLFTQEWQVKRLEILDRDNFRCQKCDGFETIFRYDKLEWSNISGVLWTDTNKKERVSIIDRPSNHPDKPYNIQIHHKKYILNRLPWEYENDDLQTLCNYCHSDVHVTEVIPIYNEDGNLLSDYTSCDRCNGTGFMPEFKHVQQGVCFKCNGDRFSIKLFVNNRKN